MEKGYGVSWIGPLNQFDHLSIWIPRLASILKCLQVGCPFALVVTSQIEEIVPAEDAGIMAITKADLYGIVTGFGNRCDSDLALAKLQYFLTAAVAANFRAG